MLESPTHRSWSGLAFERVCMLHIEQIKAALGISGVASVAYTWTAPATSDGGSGYWLKSNIARKPNDLRAMFFIYQ